MGNLRQPNVLKWSSQQCMLCNRSILCMVMSCSLYHLRKFFTWVLHRSAFAAAFGFLIIDCFVTVWSAWAPQSVLSVRFRPRFCGIVQQCAAMGQWVSLWHRTFKFIGV